MGNNTMCSMGHDNEGFDAQYEVDEDHCLGKGNFSVVYPCWRRNRPGKHYALKVISTDSHTLMPSVQEEIYTLRRLRNHPGIIRLIDIDDTPSAIRLVLELCEGGDLYDRIKQKRYYPEHEGKVVVRNLLDAVAFMHGKGIMHRDLKPENILVAGKVSNTDIKISDFGLAKSSADSQQLPRSHSICGSDFYLAPELIKQEEYGREIDIWAVAVITYIVLSGSLPFYHKVFKKLYYQILRREINFDDKPWKHASKGAQDFIMSLLQVIPQTRPSAEKSLRHSWLSGGSADRQPRDSSRTSKHNSSANLAEYEDDLIHPRVTNLEHAHRVSVDDIEEAESARVGGSPVFSVWDLAVPCGRGESRADENSDFEWET